VVPAHSAPSEGAEGRGRQWVALPCVLTLLTVSVLQPHDASNTSKVHSPRHSFHDSSTVSLCGALSICSHPSPSTLPAPAWGSPTTTERSLSISVRTASCSALCSRVS